MTSVRPLRCGLVGTGHWARITHGPALASTDGIEFTSVWGRDPEAAAELASAHGARAFADLDEFIASVEAVVFSVPPDVQAPIATRAAAAGRHLLLEKPIALTEADADALVAAVDGAGVASVVFFTYQFQPQMRAWLDGLAGRCEGGSVTWLGGAMRADSPFNSPWRREKGGLWDLGPHAVALMWAGLGPVTGVTAVGGPADISHLILRHAGGATSTVTVTLSAPAAAETAEFTLWGEAGRAMAPAGRDPVAALRVALGELAETARSERAGQPYDVRFGREVVRILAEAERQIARR